MSGYKPKTGLSDILMQIDDIINERDELEIEVDNLAEENKNFAEYLEFNNYSPCEIDNISNGWFTDRITDEGSQALLDSNIELRADIRKLRSKLTKIENICNDTNEEK